MAKRTAKTFKADVEAYLLSIGARPWPNGFYDFVLDTAIGELWITPYDKGIFCRWGNVAKARDAGLYANPYTGKWNFHCCTQQCRNAHTATLARFQAELSGFLLPPPPAADQPSTGATCA